VECLGTMVDLKQQEVENIRSKYHMSRLFTVLLAHRGERPENRDLICPIGNLGPDQLKEILAQMTLSEACLAAAFDATVARANSRE
jgi:DNA-binding transcriptional regulator YiaG